MFSPKGPPHILIYCTDLYIFGIAYHVFLSTHLLKFAYIIFSASHDFSFLGEDVGHVSSTLDEDDLLDVLRELVLPTWAEMISLNKISLSGFSDLEGPLFGSILFWGDKKLIKSYISLFLH